MKKALIVTLQGDNYGNRLQNYALQCVVGRLGLEVFTPYYKPEELSSLNRTFRYFLKILLGWLGVKQFKIHYSRYKRKQVFNLFNAEYIDNMFYVDFRKISDIDWSPYDVAIVGSDQVWYNWTGTKEELSYFFLQFIERKKRISYAASFGTSDLDNYIDIYRKGIEEIKFISVREKKGLEIINKLCGRQPYLVPDPTLLLTADEWIAFEKKPSFEHSKKFALLYFLGKKTYKATVMESELKNKGYQIVDLMNGEMACYYSTPNNFVWLIHNASYVLTDSFHACVYSILFRRKFVVFQREDRFIKNMFERIKFLLSLFNLENNFADNISSIFEIDERLVYNNDTCCLLDHFRQLGLNFLDKAIVESSYKER